MQNGFSIDEQIAELKIVVDSKEQLHSGAIRNGHVVPKDNAESLAKLKAALWTLQEVQKENAPQQGLF